MKKGFALMSVIYFMLVFSALAVSFVYLIYTESRLAMTEYRQSKAFYLAEAGRAFALRNFNATFPITKSFGGGCFIVSMTGEAANQKTLTSTGIITIEGFTYQSSCRSVANVSASGGLGDYVLYSLNPGSDSNLGSNIRINGDIFINGDLTLGSNAIISGDATAAGSITLSSGAQISGDSTSQAAPPATPPTLDSTFYNQQIALAAAMATGNATVSGSNTLSGTTYVHGNVTMANNTRVNVSGEAKIVATGTVTLGNDIVIGDHFSIISSGLININNNVTIGDQGLWYSTNGFIVSNNAEIGNVTVGSGTVFLTPGNITLNNNCEFNGLLFANGNLSIGTNADISGAVAAGSISVVGNNSVINLSSGLVNYGTILGITVGGGGGVTTTSNWTEIY